MHQLKLETSNRKDYQITFLKRVHLLKINVLTNTIKRQLLRSPRSILTMKLREKTSLDHTKSNSRLRCAEIGSYLVNASSKTSVHLLMVIMNYIKKCIYPQITKQSLAFNFILPSSVHMEIDANFCILNSISIAPNLLTIVVS